ncbi:MAG: hypothetical protein ACYCTV_03120 [Leptospirales bacterium]
MGLQKIPIQCLLIVHDPTIHRSHSLVYLFSWASNRNDHTREPPSRDRQLAQKRLSWAKEPGTSTTARKQRLGKAMF